MKCRAFLPALALLLLTACGKAELTGISLQPVTVQAGETAETAVQPSDDALAVHGGNVLVPGLPGPVVGIHRSLDRGV